jgi:hypothetical protein
VKVLQNKENNIYAQVIVFSKGGLILLKINIIPDADYQIDFKYMSGFDANKIEKLFGRTLLYLEEEARAWKFSGYKDIFKPELDAKDKAVLKHNEDWKEEILNKSKN